MIKLISLTHAQLKELRYNQWVKQKGTCPILKLPIDYKDAVFDHKHKRKKDMLGKDGKGLLRGVIHKNANVVEGKVTNSFKRYGLTKLIQLPEFLRNLADYLEAPPLDPKYIHPNERPKAEKINKRDFNKICKYYFQIYPNRKKLPVYPKSGKMNKSFKAILNIIDEIKR